MKPKTLYILFAVFVLAIAISLLLINGTNKINPPMQEMKQQEDANRPSPATILETGQAYIAVEKKGPITVVKPVSQEVNKEEEIQKNKSYQTESTSSPSGASASGSSTAGTKPSSPEKTNPGITKLGKQPTTQESKEMNARGIVLW